MTTTSLPTVIVTSVVRSTRQGQSHGGAYLVDLASGDVEQVLDWDDASISWEGRGADRGLRGVAFHQGRAYLAASDEVFVYGPSFEPLGSFGNRYLKHCHEIDLDGDRLYLSATGSDSVLAWDLRREAFVDAWNLSWSNTDRLRRKAGVGSPPVPRMRRYDPQGPDGPEPGDTCHVNNVIARDGRVWCSGTEMGHLLEIDGDDLRSWARVPLGTHNTRPFGDDVLCNDTAADAVTRRTRDGELLTSFPIPRYDPALLTHADVPGDHARQAFGRGMAVHEDRWLIVGSSPATVTVHDLGSGEQVTTVNLTMDVRNAVHGLEVWPFDDARER